MKSKRIIFHLVSIALLLFTGCTKNDKEANSFPKSLLDTLNVTHEMKGYEIYSWPEGNRWYFSVLVGTNRIKRYAEVTSVNPSAVRLITVSGLDNIKLVLSRFPEDEYITLISQSWLQKSWGGNYGNLQLPPQNYIDDINQLCIQKKLNLQIAN